MSSANDYRSDSLRMSSQTTPREVKEFLRRRIRQPYKIQDVTIFNFSNHPVVDEAIEDGVENKFENDLYQIPFSVTGSWGYFTHLLPERIRRAEILIYKSEFESYACYSNLLNQMEGNGSEFRNEMEEELKQMDIV